MEIDERAREGESDLSAGDAVFLREVFQDCLHMMGERFTTLREVVFKRAQIKMCLLSVRERKLLVRTKNIKEKSIEM